jgi:uncharacterized protein (TIGR02265 family)
MQVAVFEMGFADRRGLPAYGDWMFERCHEVMGASEFSRILPLESPKALVAGHDVWSMFVRGATLRITDATPRSARLRVTFPVSAWNAVHLTAHASMFRALLSLTGAQGPHVSVREFSTRAATFDAAWS